ncbi:MAG: SCO6745 family protein [Streptosporangiaceae bacterium]
MADAAQTARSMWTLFEPIHAVIYFTPEGRSAFEQAGLRGFWRGYFAGRAAPLGRVSAAVVTASFFGFAPGMVARAIPGIWELISPADALRTRLAGATDALGRLLPEADVAPQVAKAAGLLWEVTGELDCAGRVLAAANAALPAPDDGVSGLARLWQAVTLLREHRGDGHFAALVAAGVDGCESIVLRCGIDLRREDLQPIRGWTDEEWDAARSRLADRGWVGADGALTAAGRVAHAVVEAATDRAAARPWARLGQEASAQLAEVLSPIARACASVLPYPSPVGVPAPGTVG